LYDFSPSSLLLYRLSRVGSLSGLPTMAGMLCRFILKLTNTQMYGDIHQYGQTASTPLLFFIQEASKNLGCFSSRKKPKALVFHAGSKPESLVFFVQVAIQNLCCFSSWKQVKIHCVFHPPSKPKSLMFFIQEESQKRLFFIQEVIGVFHPGSKPKSLSPINKVQK
jgi:uncharacterized protein YfaT (DUF1175 family)